MQRDSERVRRVREDLERADLDFIICALPANLLLLSGYWPVVGMSLAIASRDGQVIVLAPEDEEQLARRSWADELHTFKPGSLSQLITTTDAIRTPLAEIAARLGTKMRIGYESADAFEPFSYVSMHLFGASIRELLATAFPTASLFPADEILGRLRAKKTSREIDHIRKACRAAAGAFATGAQQLRAGLREFEVTALFRNALSAELVDGEGAWRADGFVFCMSGPNSAEAYRAYARTGGRALATGDLALVHCNSYVDGYWTDITRTYCLGEPTPRQTEMYAAVHDARAAAIAVIRPGANAHEVDRAAREVLSQRGFGDEFKHSTGHGVGFAAIDHNARPRLHPTSDDRIETGMVSNVEPAVYLRNAGLRHCDMVAVTDRGVEVLTPFQTDLEAMVIE
jgi:Xaa-Pro aminopeptidase